MPVEERPAGADTPGRPRRDPFTLFLVVASIALAVLVIVLARQNRQLKSSLAAMAAPELPADSLKTGDQVEPIALVGAGGKKERLEFSPEGPKTLLLVFSAHCPACEKTVPLWSEFLASSPGTGFRPIGIETDRPGAVPEASGIVAAALPFPVYGVETPRPSVLDRMPYVPATVLLDGHGRVVRVWFGVPTRKQLDELRELVSG